MENEDVFTMEMSPTSPNESTEGTNSTTSPKESIEDIYKNIRDFSKSCEAENFARVENLLKKVEKTYKLHLPVERKQFHNKSGLLYRRKLIENYTDQYLRHCYGNYDWKNNADDQLFFSAATFNLGELEIAINAFKARNEYQKSINQTKDEDTVIMFLIKYCNIRHPDFLECFRILVKAEVDVNRYDIKGKSLLDYISQLYELDIDYRKLKHAVEQLTQLKDTALDEIDNNQTKKIITGSMNIDLAKFNFKTVNELSQLYLMIVKNNIEGLRNSSLLTRYVNCEEGEKTFLQLACKISDKHADVVKILLEAKANPNLTTTSFQLTPLEIAGRKKHASIFEILLKHKDTEINKEQYQNFVKMRGNPMKTQHFEALLNSEKFNVNEQSDKGNTPLHYAIIFNHKSAIEKLLKRGSSLHLKNHAGKCPLDMIEPEDLKNYFNSCVRKDGYKDSIGDPNYKMLINFSSLINEQKCQELGIVYEIGENPNLEHLLHHPLIHLLISLKWSKSKKYFYFIVFLQALIFLLLALYFYFFERLNAILFWFGLLLVYINRCKLLLFRLNFNVWKHATLHFVMELLVIITSILIILLKTFRCQKQLRAFIFVEMAICFLLTAGYHPKLSKWSIMLQKVFQSFTVLSIFFSFIIIGFAVGFRILFETDEDQQLFKNFFTSIFKTYIMTTAEFDINDVNFDSAGSGGYILFFLFSMGISLVIVNFWTGVAVTDIERIEKDSELNAFKNVVVFAKFLDKLYGSRVKTFFGYYFEKPFLFVGCYKKETSGPYEKISQETKDADKKKYCTVDFYINKEQQFETNYNNLPKSVDQLCLNKIKAFCNKPTETLNEKILKELNYLKQENEQIKKRLADLYKPQVASQPKWKRK